MLQPCSRFGRSRLPGRRKEKVPLLSRPVVPSSLSPPQEEPHTPWRPCQGVWGPRPAGQQDVARRGHTGVAVFGEGYEDQNRPVDRDNRLSSSRYPQGVCKKGKGGVIASFNTISMKEPNAVCGNEDSNSVARCSRRAPLCRI